MKTASSTEVTAPRRRGGSPMKRARKEAGLLRYTDVATMSQWNRMTPIERLMALYGESLEKCREVMFEWGDVRDMTMPQLAVWNSVRHDIMKIGKSIIEKMDVKRSSEMLELVAKQLEEGHE